MIEATATSRRRRAGRSTDAYRGLVGRFQVGARQDRSLPRPDGWIAAKLDRMAEAIDRGAGTALEPYNVVIEHAGTPRFRTSLRLDALSWALLDHIAVCHGYPSRDVLVSAIHQRAQHLDVPLTSLVRMFLLACYAPEPIVSTIGQYSPARVQRRRHG